MNEYLLYQAYGSADIINECRYSLLRLVSVYREHNVEPPSVIIYTDQPATFKAYQQYLSIFIKQIDALQIAEWHGPHNFVHLVKVNILQDCLASFGGKIIYTDTDTFCEKPLHEIYERMSPSQVYMHQFEGILNSTPAFKKWKNFFEMNDIPQFEGFSPMHIEMWNAGVIAMQKEHLPLLKDVAGLTNELYGRFKKHIAEQLSFCYAFQKHNIKILNAGAFIFHYWNLKEYRRLLKLFFEQHNHEPLETLIRKSGDIQPEKMLAEKLSYKSLNAISKFKLQLTGKAWTIEKYSV